MEFVRLEPAATFDRAILSQGKDNFITYSYKRLVEVTISQNIPPEDAEEYISWNIQSTWEYENGCFGIDYKRK